VTEHSHGLSDREFGSIFTPDRPVFFAFRGQQLGHRLRRDVTHCERLTDAAWQHEFPRATL